MEGTQKQQKLIRLLVRNLGTPGNTKTLGHLMLEAGYSVSQSKRPSVVFNSPVVQEGISEFVSKLDDKRKQAITHLTEGKLKKSSGRDLAYITDVLTKNHQLLTGGSTEKVGFKVEISKEVAEKRGLS